MNPLCNLISPEGFPKLITVLHGVVDSPPFVGVFYMLLGQIVASGVNQTGNV